MIELIIEWFKGSKKRIAFILFATALCSLVEVFLLYIMADYIDQVLIPRLPKEIIKYFFFLLSIFLVDIFFRYKTAIQLVKLEVVVSGRAVYDITNKVANYHYDFLKEKNAAYLAQRLEQDARDIVRFITGNAANVAIGACNVLGALLYLWYVNWNWIIAFILIIGTYVLFYKLVQQRLAVLSLATRESDSIYYGYLVTIFQNIKAIKIHAAEHIFSRGLIKRLIKLYSTNCSRASLSFWFSSSREIVNRIFMLVIFIYGGFCVIEGKLTIGQFVAVNTYFALALSGASVFLNMAQDYKNVEAAYIRIHELQTQKLEIFGNKILHDSLQTIELYDVSYVVNGRHIINNLSFTFERGKLYCIIGANGAGKSTLVNLLVGLIAPSTGDIRYNGIAITDLDIKKLRKKIIGFSDQEAFVNEDLLKSRQVNMKLVDGFSQGFKKIIFSKYDINLLSGGEKQKIAHSIFMQPENELLILDEPTSAMDKEDSAVLWKYLNECKNKKIIIVITHKRDEIEHADVVLNMGTGL